MAQARRETIQSVYIILFWIVIAMLFGGQQYIQYSLDGATCRFWSTMMEHIPTFMAWALFSPLIQKFLHRFPIIGSKNLIKDLIAHVLFASLINFIVLLVIGVFRWLYYRNEFEISLIDYLQRFTLAWFFYQYFIYSAMLILLLAFDYYQKFKRKETQALELQKHLIESQLTSLKSQLHPHFLFNTLNSISMLVRMRKNDEANRVISQFGDLLRQVLQKKDEQYTSLEKEIEFIANYLSIENIRFKENFQYEITVDEEALLIKVPDMILQPVVENCIKHGFKNINHPLKIDIKVRLNGEYLLIDINDNGSGFKADDETFMNHGIGLRNIMDRCQKLEGPTGVKINSKPGMGTKVSFKFPKT